MPENGKSPFGSYAVIENIRHHFDDEPHLWWEIKPPSAGDELALARYLSGGVTTVTPDGDMKADSGPSWADVLLFEIATLFGGTNIPEDPDKPLSEGGKPYISTDDSTGVIQEKLKILPMEMIAEIGDCMAENVPGWGPKNALSRAKKQRLEEERKKDSSSWRTT
jgi:hypothetical protein